ncbi:MAG: DMT family transporter [Prolixibacteraceae bacterium]|nr:DMT family transporter [Prolixibacteraceae bacterium]MBN2773546.1 DMT family transporter [Prolixibacteraceae bacterium]
MRNILKSTTFLAIMACWLWSTAFVGVKIGLEYQTPLQFAGTRFFISGIALIVIFGNLKKYFNELKKYRNFIIKLGFIQIFLQYTFFYSGMNLVPSALGAMIIGSSPLFIAVVSHFSFHNDKISPLKLASILIGVIGIAIITIGKKKVEMGGYAELIGIILLFINNLISGYANVIIAKKSAGISPMVLSSTTLILGGILLYIVSIPVEGIDLSVKPLNYYLSLGWLSFLSAAAFTIWYHLLQRPGVKVSFLNIWKFLIPVSGAILSWIIITTEKPETVSIVGMAVITVSLVLLNYANRRYAAK